MRKLEIEFRNLLERYKNNEVTAGVIIDLLSKKKKVGFRECFS